jgi:tetratricopeptide (TPR) repeat protein
VDALYYTGLVRVAQDRLEEAAEAFERARAVAPQDEAVLFQLGVVYFTLSKYDQAQALLENVFARRPSLDGLGYYVGFMRYRQKDYQGALRAFRGGASTDPDIQQLTRFYTGLTLAVLGLPERAAAEIEEAMRLQPASPLTGPAERLRDAVVAARERERRFRIEARFGAFYDDNVSVNPVPSSDPLVQTLRSKSPRSTGELAAVRFDYTFLRQDAFEMAATWSFFTTYNNDLPSFNVVNYLGALTGSYRGTVATLPYQLTVQYTYDYLTLDDDEFVQRHTVAPVLAVVEDSINLTALQLRYQKKQFSNDTNIPREEKRDANNWMIGLTHIFRFESDRHLIKLGYQFDYDDTDGDNRRGRNFAYAGHRLLAGAQYTLPWYGIRLKYDFDLHFRDYQHKNTLLPIANPNSKERFDTEFNNILGVVIPLPWNFTFSIEYQSTRAYSNLDVFSFSRNVVSGVLIWSY